MSDDEKIPTCEVPGCNEPSEYVSPRYWCVGHWQMWWDWPEDQPEPDWMPNSEV